MTASRWEEVHGENGLCQTIVEYIQAVIELRFRLEYGDYLAVSCGALKGFQFQGYLPKKQNQCTWIDIASKLKDELKKMDIWRGEQSPAIGL